ncbi:hypothetical protein BGX26_001442 [Mortierella sp. AD094]|nr:hypothetical protein BGX26_001442 [Mortierella sp. AD094]
MHSQRFRSGEEIWSLAVQQSPDGKLYTPLDDIQDVFPGATRFTVNGTVVFPLKDENGNRYQPHMIGFYPYDIIDAVVTPDKSSPSHDYSDILPQRQTQSSPIDQYLGQVPSTPLPVTYSSTSSSINTSMSQLSTSCLPLPQSHIIERSKTNVTLRPSATFSSMLATTSSKIDSNITELRHELAQHTDSQSTRHIQLMEQLLHMLQLQAEAKERELEMLQNQAEAKERDEEHKKMLQQSIDRLANLQRSVDAVLVQTYELHEYPIPRLFVILPEKEASQVLKEESNDDTKKDLDTETSPVHYVAKSTNNTKNSVHLAKHEGYELSRPTQFLKQYGPYILGMLQILKFCLDASKFVAPVIGPAHETLSKVTDHVKSASENTLMLAAIDTSIGFLQTKLANDGAFGAQAGIAGSGSDDDIFKNLAALEGADLRQLETFLRNKDKDKILGNLYRVTTPEGHVRWVCIEHVRTSYRENAMRSLLNTIEVNHGFYDKQLRKITMALSSSMVTKDFMSQLVTYSFAADELDLTLDFRFGSSDLRGIVKSIAQSKVRILKLDLKDTEGPGRVDIELPGTAKYHPLLELLSNRKLQQLSMTGMDYFGSRTSDLSKNHEQSTLRSFHYLNLIRASDSTRLINILSLCTNLVDLRLGSRYNSRCQPKLCRAIATLKRLEVLHLIGLYEVDGSTYYVEGNSSYSRGILSEIVAADIKLRELVIVGETALREDVDKAVHAFASTLEILNIDNPNVEIDLQSPRFKYEHGFPKLTNLDANTKITERTFQLLSSTLNHSLSQLAILDRRLLLQIANFTALRTVTIGEVDATDLLPFWKSFPENGGSSQIDSATFFDIKGGDGSHSHMMAVPLRKLWLNGCEESFATDLLKRLVFSKLEVLAVSCMGSPAGAELAGIEQTIARRHEDFPIQLMIHLVKYHERDPREGENHIKVINANSPKELRGIGVVRNISSSGTVGFEQGKTKELDPRRVMRYQVVSGRYLWRQLMNS